MSELDELKIKTDLDSIVDYLEDDPMGGLKGAFDDLRVPIDMIPVALMVHRAGKIIYVNPQFLGLLGYAGAYELIGQSVMTFVPPENRSLIESRIHKMAENGDVYNPPLENEVVKKDGTRVWAEAQAIAISHLGEPAIMVIFRDITLKKKTQEDLVKSEENFQTIIKEMPDGVLIADEGEVLFVNNAFAKMLGYGSPLEIIGWSLLDLIHPDYHGICQERLSLLMKDGQPVTNTKFKLIGKDGKAIEVESAGIPIQFNGKKAAMGVISDNTLQNEMRRQATLNDKLATVGTLAAGVAHEVNNPLTYILGNLSFLGEQLEEMKAHMLQKGCADQECIKILKEMTEEVAETTKGGERIRDIVKGLKAFVRSSDDKAEKVDLNQMVESALNMTYHIFKQKARLEKDLAVDMPLLMIHSGKIQQVFINLIINAAQAIEGNQPGKNKIRVRTGHNINGLFVEFTDTGKGIPENILPRIFDPFFTTKPTGVGTGLGLSVCNEILRHYQGSLEVKSQVGQGTTFTVRLPILEEPLTEREELIQHSGSQFGRVLVVDDEPGNLEVMCRAIRKKHTVLKALSGLEAMAVLAKEDGQIDAVVTDVNMPDMNGIDFYQAVESQYPDLEKRFIFMTGGIFSEETKDFLKKIPNVCLEKPFKFEEMLKAVSQWISEPAVPEG
ncbi:MAG TPA: PAS domain S-box protein [bacterium]|jgi:two-component system cell cycle sensor histidine kinase/response regulator CckA|nr:PAS domain S-box protein [bacterium]